MISRRDSAHVRAREAHLKRVFRSGVFMPYVSGSDRTPIWPSRVPLPSGIHDGERRFHMQTRGMWSALSRLEGLAVTEEPGGVRVWGDRSLRDPSEEGYSVHGSVSLLSTRRRAFTSSMLFFVRDRLVNFAVLRVTAPAVHGPADLRCHEHEDCRENPSIGRACLRARRDLRRRR